MTQPSHMTTVNPASTRSPRASVAAPLVLATAIVLVGVAGVYAYGANGAGLFVAMIETGLAWCF